MASTAVQETVVPNLTFEPREMAPIRSDREAREVAIQKIFQQRALLIRAVECETTGSPIERSAGVFPNTSTVSDEIDFMRSTGLRNASCTLIVPGRRVTSYKPYGFLLNGHTSDLVHVAISDIGSCTDSEDRLIAPESMNLKTLEALSRYIEMTPVTERPDMNEVNAHFDSRDLLGLFVPDADSMKLDILIVQSAIKSRYAMDLPVYIYDPELGDLTKYQPDQAQIRTLLIRSRRRLGIPLCQSIARIFDMTMTDRGRLYRT